MQRLLLLADIHGNFPALAAIEDHFSDTRFDHIINCGDSLVYAPFPNQVLEWLQKFKSISILGNTDRKVKKMLQNKKIKKPSNPEKRIMYSHTAEQLSKKNQKFLRSLKKCAFLTIQNSTTADERDSFLVGVFHGSPDKANEFLFADTPLARFQELAADHPYRIIITGHSHTPYYKLVGDTHFINPGSVGRMFDGNPATSCAILEIEGKQLDVQHFRIPYDVKETIKELHRQDLPPLYQTMYLLAKKLN